MLHAPSQYVKVDPINPPHQASFLVVKFDELYFQRKYRVVQPVIKFVYPLGNTKDPTSIVPTV